ncbi:MAG: 2-dehydropantoate 2-reductase [Betaproteobacteria bacterium]|nr:2-dehydropantoate 2-reductase [Betaproteobacteria bacterium]
MATRRSSKGPAAAALPRERRAHYPIAIVGPGALGLHYAARLARVMPTALVARSTARAAQLRAGVTVGARRLRPHAYGPENLPSADWVIILVKAQDSLPAARVAARMAPKGVLSLQNGLVEELLRKRLAGIRAAQGVTTEGAYRERGRIVPAGHGETLMPRGYAPLARMLRRAGFEVRIERDLAAARLRKLLVNVSINPVAALFRVPNGRVIEAPYAHFARELTDEAAAVLAAEGLRIGATQAWERVVAVARATANNRASMLQDIVAGRRTEIDFLTGALIRLAARHRIAVPTHRAFYRLIRLLEQSKSERRAAT